eukprot:4067790-Pleurochrysis_carterae.AAC.1
MGRLGQTLCGIDRHDAQKKTLAREKRRRGASGQARSPNRKFSNKFAGAGCGRERKSFPASRRARPWWLS